MYKLIYDETGNVSTIQKDNMSINPFVPDSQEMQDFNEWNTEQREPLDITKSIVVKKTAEQEYEEQVQAKEREILRSLAVAELEAQVNVK